MAGERASTATVLFTDLVGSTEIRRSLGDDQADDVRRRHDDAVRTAAAEHLGEVVKGTGDGLMIVFPAAAQGVSGAVAIQRAIARLNRSLPVRLVVRVGISAGDVAWEGDDCFGSPVVEAARLCGAADEAQILTSEVVRLLAGSRGGHRLEPAGSFQLKGLGEMQAYQVPWEPEPPGVHPLPGPLAGVETLPLIARREEREVLQTAWKHSVEGAPHVVLVSGEPGVGKTRLVAEVARVVHEAGAVVLFGRCDEEMGVPYQPFTEAIATYAAALDAATLAAQLGGSAADLARLVPSLGDHMHLAEPLRADPETERYRLFEACSHLFDAIAAGAPVLLVLDDVHWAARPTLLLLRHLVRHRSSGPVMIVATYRDTDLGRGHPLAEVLADLRREHAVERIALRGLTEPDVAELVATAAGHDLDAATARFAQQLHVETEGNPFFVGQVLRHLVETGGLVVEDGRWVVRSTRIEGLPEGVREVVGRRLAQLAPGSDELLAVAAVIGREFDSALLAEVSRTDEDQLLDALEEAEAARLVVPVSGHDGRRTFAHALVRSTLYEEIPTTRRLRIHRRVVEALAPRAERGVPCLDQLAHHACEAAALGDVDGAVRWSHAAAAAALDRLAYEEAASQLERALSVLDPDDPIHAPARASLGVDLARALRAAGAHAPSRAAALAAIEQARQADRADLLADAALVVAGERGWSEAGVVDNELIALLTEALERLPLEGSSRRAMALARLGGELYFLPDELERRQRLADEAIQMAEHLDDPEALAFVLSCALWGSWVPDNAAQRLELAERIVMLGIRSGNRLYELTGALFGGGCLAELGDGPGFRSSVERANEIAGVLRRPEWLWAVGVQRTAVALMEARLDEAAALAEETVNIGAPLSSETVMQMYGVHLFSLARARGGAETLLPLLQGMVDQYPLIPAWRAGLAYLYRDLGMLDQARTEVDRLAVDDFAAVPLDANWKVGVHLIASVCWSLEDRPRAAVLYDLLAPMEATVVTAGLPAEVLGPAHGTLMLLSLCLERWDEAAAHYERAQALVDGMGNRQWSIYLRADWAAGLLRRQRPEDAEVARLLLEGCSAECAELGMIRTGAEVAAQLSARG